MSALSHLEYDLSAEEYLFLEGLSPFRHEFFDGVMYAMGCESASDYFQLETESPFRHEYFDGVMYAMAGAKEPHHILERNLSGMLYQRLRGKRCKNMVSNVKLRLPSEIPDEDLCYPDAMISCDPTDRGETKGHAWIERPSVIFEIISQSTRRADEGRKRDAYLALPSLDAYVRLEQDRAELILEKREGERWVQDRIRGLDATLRLPTIGIELPLAELYDEVKLPV